MKNLKNFYFPLFFSIIIITFITLKPYPQHVSKSSFIDNIESKDEVTFYIASDIHYLSNNLTDYGSAFDKFIKSGDGKQVEYMNDVLDQFSSEIKTNKPDFLILSGDLTLNGEKQSHLDLSKKLSNIKASGVSIYLIPGNHDINNPWAREFNGETMLKTDFISKEDFVNIYKDFGFNDAISRDKNSLSYLVAPSSNLYILMLDDNVYKNNLSIKYPEVIGTLSKETLDWINYCGKLAKDNGAKIIAVSHHNIINHSNYIYEGFTIDNNEDVLNIFKKNSIKLCFSGHIHFQSIKNISVEDYNIKDIASSSLAIYPFKYGIAKLNKDNFLSYSTAAINMDNISSSFKTNSRKCFINFVYKQNSNNLSYIDSYNHEEIKDMCNAICNIRLKYNDPSEAISWNEITSSTGFKLLKTCPSPFIKHYIDIALNSLENSNNTNNNNLNIKL